MSEEKFVTKLSTICCLLAFLFLPFFSSCDTSDTVTARSLWELLYAERFDAFSQNLDSYQGDINATDQLGQTFLIYMSYLPEPDIIKKLIEKGANVNKTSPSGNSPLRAAAYKDSVAVAQVLIQAGADVDILDEDKATPLHMAAARKSYNLMLILLENGANPNAKNKCGWTPLQRLLMNPQKPSLKIVELLLNHAADPTYRNPHPVYADSTISFTRPTYPTGNTALEIAENGNYKEIVTLLRQYGATE